MTGDSIEKRALSELESLITSGCLDDRNIYFMGNIHNLFPLIKQVSEYRKTSFIGVLDNNPELARKHEFEGIKYTTFLPSSMIGSDRSDRDVVIIFSERFWCEMRDQMIRLGKEDGVNLFILAEYSQKRLRSRITEGFRLIQEFRKKYGEDVFVAVFYGPVGDCYYFALFLKEYLLLKGYRNILCVGGGAAQKICTIFGFDQFETVSRDQIVALEKLYMFLGNEDIAGIKPLQIWDWGFHFNRSRIRLNSGFTFMDTFSDMVFAGNKYEDNVVSQDKESADVERHLKSLGFPKGKTVLISPFAYSIRYQPPKQFWNILVGKITESGYTPVLNVDPRPMHDLNEEDYLKQIRMISPELKDMVSVMEYFGFFISMRSGLCDVTARAQCRKVIFYPQMLADKIDLDRHRADRSFGGLREMEVCNDVNEIDFDIEKAVDSDSEENFLFDEKYWNAMADAVVEMLK